MGTRDNWETAAADLGLSIEQSPSRFSANGLLAGMIDGFLVTVSKSSGDDASTVIQVKFSSPTGPPGLSVKRRKHSWRSGRVRQRLGWQHFEGGNKRRTVLAKADDPNQLALWMTADRVEALSSFQVPGHFVTVTRDQVESITTYLRPRKGRTSAVIVAEVRRLIPLARRLT